MKKASVFFAASVLCIILCVVLNGNFDAAFAVTSGCILAVLAAAMVYMGIDSVRRDLRVTAQLYAEMKNIFEQNSENIKQLGEIIETGNSALKKEMEDVTDHIFDNIINLNSSIDNMKEEICNEIIEHRESNSTEMKNVRNYIKELMNHEIGNFRNANKDFARDLEKAVEDIHDKNSEYIADIKKYTEDIARLNEKDIKIMKEILDGK